MASESKIAIAMEEANPKPQNETTPQSNSLSSSPTKFSSATSDYAYFSKLLQGVMAANSTVSSNPLVKDASFQGQFGMSHQEALASVTAKAAAEARIQKLQPKSSKSSPKPRLSNQPEPSVPCSSSTLTHEEKPSVQHKCQLQERNDKSSCSPHKPLTVQLANGKAGDIPRTPNSDGFSWRKYGQKQVKNSGSSRSYYRCTYYNCCAKKKVQHLDISGRIIEVVYKGDHNHDPPQNLKGSSRKRDRDAPLAPQVNDLHESSAQKLDGSLTPTSNCQKEVDQRVVPLSHESSEECVMSSDQTPRVKNEASTLPREAEGCKSTNADDIGLTDSMKEYEVVPFKKRRIKVSGKASGESVYRTFKEPKVVIHAAGDVGSSTDGYRWRKYGQKMVKGNPNPRSYYRCSSSGCPVRKHVERSTDNSTAIIVTYEGIHDHEKPLPKGSPKSDQPKSPPQRSTEEDSDLKGDKPKEGGSDKVLESARTLLSIGIELKSC